LAENAKKELHDLPPAHASRFAPTSQASRPGSAKPKTFTGA
jgi:hypothetical protein